VTGRWRIWALLAGAGVIAVAVGACGDSDRRPSRGGSPARVTAAEPDTACDAKVTRRVRIPVGSGRIAIGGYANLVAVGHGSVWVPVADPAAPNERITLLGIDPVSGAVTRWRYAGSSEVRIRAGGGAVWLADPQTRELTRIDIATGRRIVRRPFGAYRAPRELAVGAGRVWLVPETGGDLAVADLRDGRVRRRIQTGVSTIGDVAPAGQIVWLSPAGPPMVMRLDARSGRPVGKPVRVDATALDIDATPDRAWVDLGD